MPRPEDVIYAMLDAIRDGDLDKYFDAHTGAMAASLRRAAVEVTEAQFLKALQEKNAQLKGVAMMEPERLSDREMKARVEYVFVDRTEVQTFYLEKIGERWKIARVDGAAPIKTPVPHGTRVN